MKDGRVRGRDGYVDFGGVEDVPHDDKAVSVEEGPLALGIFDGERLHIAVLI
jgi:hypothetical protein